jgi:hypothetical protein
MCDYWDDSDDKRWGVDSNEKGKRGEYFNNNFEKCNLRIYYSSEGDNCRVEGMQYILLAIM